MSYSRCCHRCCGHAGGLLVCGGKDGLASTCCEKFNINDKEWKLVAELTEARIYFQIVSSWTFIWAIGGRCKNRVLHSTEYYDEVVNKWTLSTPMLEKRTRH